MAETSNQLGMSTDFGNLPGGINIVPSFSNVYTPTQTAYGGGISIGVPTGAYAPSGTTGGANDGKMMIYMIIVVAIVIMLAALMTMKR